VIYILLDELLYIFGRWCPVPDVNLCLILMKVHMRLLEPFNRYFQCTRGEKVDYALKKNLRDFWATRFSCCVADLHLRLGKKIYVRLFSCKTISHIQRFVPAGLILYVGTKSNLRSRRICTRKQGFW
jgi:hypothetical protein